MLEGTVGVAAEISLGRVFGTVLLSSLRTESASGVARTPKEDVTSFVVADTGACGVSKAACAEAGPGTPGVDTATTACAAATTATAGIAVAASGRAAPAACAPATSARGASGVGNEGVDPYPLDDGSLWGDVRREKEGWVVNPKLVVIDALFNLLDNVIECADCPGEVIG